MAAIRTVVNGASTEEFQFIEAVPSPNERKATLWEAQERRAAMSAKDAGWIRLPGRESEQMRRLIDGLRLSCGDCLRRLVSKMGWIETARARNPMMMGGATGTKKQKSAHRTVRAILTRSLHEDRASLLKGVKRRYCIGMSFCAATSPMVIGSKTDRPNKMGTARQRALLVRGRSFIARARSKSIRAPMRSAKSAT